MNGSGTSHGLWEKTLEPGNGLLIVLSDRLVNSLKQTQSGCSESNRYSWLVDELAVNRDGEQWTELYEYETTQMQDENLFRDLAIPDFTHNNKDSEIEGNKISDDNDDVNNLYHGWTRRSVPVSVQDRRTTDGNDWTKEIHFSPASHPTKPASRTIHVTPSIVSGLKRLLLGQRVRRELHAGKWFGEIHIVYI